MSTSIDVFSKSSTVDASLAGLSRVF
jgi:hypothetical protein